MPPQPLWLPRVKSIIESLDSGHIASLPFLTRASVEQLFGIRRRQAIDLMHRMDHYQIGKELVVSPAVLKRWLARAGIGEKVWFAEVVRTRVEELVEQAQWEREARKTRVVVPHKTVELKLEGMPPTVSLQPGEMRIAFSGAEDCLGNYLRSPR